MPKKFRRTIVVDGIKTEVIEPEESLSDFDEPPPNPSWKHLKTGLILKDLKDVTQMFRDQLNPMRRDIQPEVRSTIRWYLECVDQILSMYENYNHFDRPFGRPRKEDERSIAKEVVLEYQQLNGDATKFPTGNYLYERLLSINENRIAKGTKKLNISEKSCDNWISEMRNGKFDLLDQNDFDDFISYCESFDPPQ